MTYGRIRLLPLLVLVSFLSFTVRMGEMLSETGAHSGSAFAQPHEEAAGPPETTPPPMSGDSAGDQHAAEESKDSLPPPVPAIEVGKEDGGHETIAVPEKGWQDAGDTAIDMSDVQLEIYKDLSARRESLEKREKDMSQREALLKAGERELEQKLRELTVIRNEIEGLLKKQSEEEAGRLSSLVKIYEGMKAKDAARIFNTLDMDVLIKVMTNMSERKTAPILAEMDADRARSVTILMAQQRQMPGLPVQ